MELLLISTTTTSRVSHLVWRLHKTGYFVPLAVVQIIIGMLSMQSFCNEVASALLSTGSADSFLSLYLSRQATGGSDVFVEVSPA